MNSRDIEPKAQPFVLQFQPIREQKQYSADMICPHEGMTLSTLL